MKKISTLLFVVLLAASLAACGSNESGSISDGTKTMKDAIAELKAAVDAGDAELAKKQADEMDEAWESFEDSVKDQSAELYEKAETPLHAIMAAVKIDPLDAASIQAAADELNEVLSEIQEL